MKKRFYVEAKSLKLSVNFFFNFTFDGLNSWLIKNDYLKIEKEFSKNTLGLYWTAYDKKEDNIIYGVWIKNFDLSKDSLGLLVHELHHVVERQSEEKGLSCMETKAYLIEYYFKEVLKKFKFK